MKKSLILAVALMTSLVFSPHARAATATTTMHVLVVVDPVAVVSVTNMDFGITLPGDRNIQSTSTISVTVTKEVPYSISLDYGQNYDGNWRRLASGKSFTQYGLFKDSGDTAQWGDSDLANTYPYGTSVPGIGTGVSQNLAVYGAIFSVIDPGVYNDVVTVTVTY